MSLAMVWLGGLLGLGGVVAGHFIYHWYWCRRWDRDHRNCCRTKRP